MSGCQKKNKLSAPKASPLPKLAVTKAQKKKKHSSSSSSSSSKKKEKTQKKKKSSSSSSSRSSSSCSSSSSSSTCSTSTTSSCSVACPKKQKKQKGKKSSKKCEKRRNSFRGPCGTGTLSSTVTAPATLPAPGTLANGTTSPELFLIPFCTGSTATAPTSGIALFNTKTACGTVQSDPNVCTDPFLGLTICKPGCVCVSATLVLAFTDLGATGLQAAGNTITASVVFIPFSNQSSSAFGCPPVQIVPGATGSVTTTATNVGTATTAGAVTITIPQTQFCTGCPGVFEVRICATVPTATPTLLMGFAGFGLLTSSSTFTVVETSCKRDSFCNKKGKSKSSKCGSDCFANSCSCGSCSSFPSSGCGSCSSFPSSGCCSQFTSFAPTTCSTCPTFGSGLNFGMSGCSGCSGCSTGCSGCGF